VGGTSTLALRISECTRRLYAAAALSLDQALQLTDHAEILMQGREYEVSSVLVLSLVAGTRCSAYDGEFVALARDLGLPLVTSDTRLLAEFPTTTIAMDMFGV
jgi:predicted nucleic acid-binding protein